jgi:hypothetical protein
MSGRSTSVLAVAAVLTLGVAACGGNDDSSGGSGAAGPRRGIQLTAQQRSCLKAQGVDFGQRRNRGGSGQPPQLTDKQRKQFAEQRQKMQAAFEKCGIQAPRFGQGGPPPGQGDGQAPSTSQQ